MFIFFFEYFELGFNSLTQIRNICAAAARAAVGRIEGAGAGAVRRPRLDVPSRRPGCAGQDHRAMGHARHPIGGPPPVLGQPCGIQCAGE